jgi:hypothetical protein
LHELQQDYPESLAIIAWHNGDEFEFPQGMVRDGWYGIAGYPTVWFDGYADVVGGYQPSSYPYYVPVMQERVPWPSNFEVFIEITPTEGTDYNVFTKIEIKNGNSTENLAGFVVLTENDIPSPGNENQFWVARNVWPDAMGLPLDFSVETSHTWNTVVTIEDDYVYENCEAIAFIQNMDTKEIYQATSLMMTEVTTSFPPATNLTYEVSGSDVVLNWDEPVTDGLIGYNIFHAFELGMFELLDFTEESTFTHLAPGNGLHQYYVTAVYVSQESDPTNIVELTLTGIGEDLSSKIEFYPNPVSDRLNIKASTKIDRIEIYNHLGQLVKEFLTTSNNINMDVSELHPGLYLFKLTAENGSAIRQVMIE